MVNRSHPAMSQLAPSTDNNYIASSYLKYKSLVSYHNAIGLVVIMYLELCRTLLWNLNVPVHIRKENPAVVGEEVVITEEVVVTMEEVVIIMEEEEEEKVLEKR